MARETAPELRPIGAISEEGRTLGALFLNLISRQPDAAGIVIDLYDTKASLIQAAPISAEAIDWTTDPDELVAHYPYTDLVHGLVARILGVPYDYMLEPDNLTVAATILHKRPQQEWPVAKFAFLASETDRFQRNQERAQLEKLAETAARPNPPEPYPEPYAA